MEILIYAVIFIIGTLFGSFFTLAVYRIPLKKDITHERSFCPNCNHRLEFLDLIPVLSYIFLGGKCRYCKQKIRPRYLLLELLTGFTFLLFALQLNLNIFNFDISKLVFLVYGLLYISTLFIIAGIDKENHFISKGVLIFGLIISAMYIIYLYILRFNIYKYVIYLILVFVFLIIEKIISKKQKKETYSLQILALCMHLAIFTNEVFVIIGLILSLLLISIKQIARRGELRAPANNPKKIDNACQIPIGYYICVTNIIIILIQNITL